MIESDGLFDIAPLELPAELKGMKIAPSAILSETQILVLLYEEYTLPVLKEVGIYDLNSGEYRVSFAIDEGKTISIEWAADDLVLYKVADSSVNDISLHCFRLDTGEDFLVHQFSRGYSGASASQNQVVSYNGKIYFDDIVTHEGELVGVNLLEYDLESREVTLYQENAQNPLLLNFGLAYIARDEATGSFFVESSKMEEKIPLGQGISGLASAGNEMLLAYNRKCKYTLPWNKLYDKSRFKVSDSSDQETEETYKQPDFENFEEGENTEQ